MTAFRAFEAQVIRRLAGRQLPSGVLDRVLSASSLSDYEYTGAGYFASVENDELPEENFVCDEPFIAGEVNGYRVGFVVFLGGLELTLECHAMGQGDVPADFRDLEVELSTPPVNRVDLDAT